ncbi:hypothetical protein L3054_11210 [Corynebacterium sp. MC-10]|nr:hypothetical protein [Corynebacterium parakroppenstedtii]
MINLDGTNFHIWKGKMEDLLVVKNMDLPIFATEKPETKSEEEWRRDHRQVCGFIRQFVGDNVYGLIANESHARTL